MQQAAIYDDSGRYPLVKELSKPVFAYVDKLNEMEVSQT